MRLSLFFLFIFSVLYSDAQKFKLFIGTYTGSGSKGIYVYSFNSATGKAEWICNTDSTTNPSFLVLSKDEKYVYAVNETHGSDSGRISAFSFNEKAKKLELVNSQVTGGDDPCHVSLNKNNKWAVVANYSSGNTSVFAIQDDGSIQPYAQLINDTGKSINNARQEKPHVHEAVFSPDFNYVFTPDLGTDKIMVYKFNPQNNKPLQPADDLIVESTPGGGPRHITFHPTKNFAYLIEELSGTVTVYKYKNGKLSSLQQILTHPEGYTGAIGSAEITLSNDGKFLYASNRGDENTITTFLVNQTTGKLIKKGYQSTLGIAPRNFIIDPTGNYLLVANQESDNIVIFKRNKKTGLLQPSGNQIKIPKPVCLQMSR